MKKIIVLTLFLITTPLLAGPYCMNNSENLAKPYDTKEWHYVDCDCNCKGEVIKGNHCIACGHLQYAPLMTIVSSTKKSHITPQSIVHAPDNPENVLKKLAARYLLNK
ncbi:MAG TPA: hypothetical protein VKR54_01510 [Candidatus Babeliales bacterium]|jgi:hypothetical protein|nr:hypothetical protein [Candidatus Babeliales bacterium]